MRDPIRVFAFSVACLVSACASSGAPPLPANVGSTTPERDTTPPPPKAPHAIDPKAVAAATGAEPQVDAGVVKVTWPRTDVEVDVDGLVMPPFLGLTSWVAFTGATKPDVEAMIMGDLVLFQDEVSPVMSALLERGIEVTALHNHFLYEKPRVFFLHVGGEGAVATLGKAIAESLDVARAIRAKSPTPADGFGAPPPKTPSTLDAARLDQALRVKGTAKDGMYKAVFERTAKASCGCAIGKGMGVSTWAAFAGSPDDAVVDGDFAVTEDELQPVLKSLRRAGIHVVAIHHHMTGEAPRVLFLHYWGRGGAVELAGTIRKTLDLTAAGAAPSGT